MGLTKISTFTVAIFIYTRSDSNDSLSLRQRKIRFDTLKRNTQHRRETKTETRRNITFASFMIVAKGAIRRRLC